MYILNEPALFPINYLGYVDPTDHYSYKGIPQSDATLRKYDSIEDLISHVTKRREALNYPPIPHLSLIIQNYIYLLGQAPRSYFHEYTPSPDFPRTAIKDIEVGSKLAYQLSRSALTGLFSAGSSGWVTKTEATNRAQICINCPKNILTKKSRLTKFNNKLAAVFTMHRKTPYDNDLHDCGVCGCPLAEKVHYASDIIKKTTTQSAAAFPDNFIGLKDRKRYSCWVKEILEKK